ncbi:hemolysin-III channel protein Izh2 [Wilcoxina mikolae CBS 423.85]|nr:hemolysin-III channel protein Izh2 [Wilcoxina mikolae CBS 423.85]
MTTSSSPRLRKPTPPSGSISTEMATSKGTANRSQSSPALLSYNEISHWHQGNEYISTGYRTETDSVSKCFASWTYIHNETVNIYSHILPAILFIIAEVLSYQMFLSTYPEATRADRLAFECFLLTAAICLGISGTYHTLMNHSEDVSNIWLRLDFLGIIILIEGCFLSGIYVGFYCERTLQGIYWAMIICLGCISTIIILNPKFQGPRWRTFRLSTFICTGLSALAPITHGIKIFGLQQMSKQSGLPYYLFEGLLLVIGAFFYKARLPESLKPRTFDIWGASHQIFHILVVLAAMVHLVGIGSAFDYNYTHKRCATMT